MSDLLARMTPGEMLAWILVIVCYCVLFAAVGPSLWEDACECWRDIRAGHLWPDGKE